MNSTWTEVVTSLAKSLLSFFLRRKKAKPRPSSK